MVALSRVSRSGGHTMSLPVLALGALTAFASLSLAGWPAAAQQQQKPNIVVIFGDDIGQSNVSAYSRGMMGYKTPNIDRVANEGVMFTDFYAEQSCTAGRASFITGQSGLRTGLTKVGLPGATAAQSSALANAILILVGGFSDAPCREP